MSGEDGLARVSEGIDETLGMIRALYERDTQQDRATMPYREYLETPWWQELRRSKVRAAGFRCEWCGGGRRRLDVHHLTYERRGYELWEDLIVLCRACHEAEHGAS